MLAAADFGLSDEQARRIMSEVDDATSSWREVATANANGVSASQITRFNGAFETLRGRLATGSGETAKATASTKVTADRGVSTPQSNTGSFKARQRAEADN